MNDTRPTPIPTPCLTATTVCVHTKQYVRCTVTAYKCQGRYEMTLVDTYMLLTFLYNFPNPVVKH